MTTFTILDTETTGLNPQWGDNIIEVALLQATFDGKEWKETARYDTLVKPDMEVTERVTYITGIRPEDLENAPRFAEVRARVEGYLPGTIIVGHNIEFDLTFLQGSGIDTKQLQRIDTMDLAGLFEDDGKSLSLQSLAMRHEVEHDAHRAMGDVLATYEILKKYAALIGGLSPEILSALSPAVSRVEWPAKVFFPATKDLVPKQALEALLAAKESPLTPLQGGRTANASSAQEGHTPLAKHKGGSGEFGSSEQFLPELTNLLSGQRPSVLSMRAPALHDIDILDACQSYAHEHDQPLRLVLTDFSDGILARLRADPSLRSVSPEYAIDLGRLANFLSAEHWEKDRFLFAVRLLMWLSTSASGNTRELQQKHPERKYLYAILPIEVAPPEPAPRNQPVRVCSLREFLDLPEDQTPTVVVDATFLDEELIRARTETLTLRRAMGVLQAVEETLVTSSVPFPNDALHQCQEKAAFFFAHLANAMAHFEEKETRLTAGMRSDRKIAESLLLAQTLQHCVSSILQDNAAGLCAALKRELRAISMILSAYADPAETSHITLSTRGRDEGCVQVYRDEGTSMPAAMHDAILVCSPSRTNNTLIRGLSGITHSSQDYHLPTTVAADMRPDATAAYIQDLSDWMRTKLYASPRDAIFIFGNGKLLEQVVMGLEPFLKEKTIDYCAERLQGGMAKVREWYERNGNNVLFCTADFFLSLDPAKVPANQFILQKLPFGVERSILPSIRPEAVFASVTLPKSLYRFERILEQINLIASSDKHLTVLDNKLLTDKGYGQGFRDMLSPGWESKPLKEIR